MHAIQNITQLLGQTQWYHLREKPLACHDGQALGQSWCAVWSVRAGVVHAKRPHQWIPPWSCSLTLSLLWVLI